MQTTTGNLLWDKLDLHPWLEEAVKSLEFKLMTPVQASTIPLLCGSKDVIVESVTGSGKTLAFVIPMLEKLSKYLYVEKDKIKKGHFFGVVISPTRELSNQINNVFLSVLKFLPPELIPIKTQLLVGGNSTIRDDLSYFANNSPQILIATPGRLLDFISSQKVKLNSIEMVILDEADKLLDISFSKDVINILHKLPKQRRTGLFSATLSAAGDNVFRTGMTNPVKITVKGSTTSNVAPKSLNLSYMLVDPKLKIMTLLKLLEKYRFKKAIVYFPTCTSIKYFYAMFKHCLEEYPCQFYSLHGKLTTNSRLKILNLFTNADSFDGKHVLMTTDVAARGIDIPDVDLVIQIDPPTDPDIFLHRCGRTGRANKVGKAITFLNGSENSHEIEYVDFMAVKHVDILPMETEDVGDIDWFYDKVQQWILKDRLLYELSVKSYVGFVKYYSKHIASSIFRLNLLDYMALGKMYGLIRLPKMPELKYVPADQFPEDGWFIEPMDMDNYAYADEAKEHKRLAELEAEKAKKIEASKRRKELEKKNESWSKKIEKKEVKTERKEKIKRKRDVIEQEIEDDSSDEEVAVDWKDLVRENKKNKSSMQGSFDDL